MPAFLGWFQIVGLALFLGIFVGRTLYLRIRSRISPITLSVVKGWRGLVEVSLFLLVNVWAAEVVLHARRPHWSLLPPLNIQVLNSMPVKLAGLALVVLGLAIFIQAIRDMGSSWRLGIDEKSPGRLVTSGIYAYSRHPIYLFFNLYFIGTFLLNGTLVFALFTVLIALNLHLQILQEESFLLRTYGADYRRYCLQVSRYLGRRAPQPRAASAGD